MVAPRPISRSSGCGPKTTMSTARLCHPHRYVGISSLMTVSPATTLVSAFAPIPGGWFTMGTERGQDDERPPHKVFVDPFELGVYPVTRAAYEDFVAATGHDHPKGWERPELAQPDLPVVGVSWLDAAAYCAWRSDADGRSVRLATGGGGDRESG